MKKRMLAVILVCAMVLCGCVSGKNLIGYDGEFTAYKDMVYERPDSQTLENTLAECCRIARTSTDLEEVIDTVYVYYDAYDWFYTNYNLAYIEYNRDITSEKWEEEYDLCAELSSDVEAGLEELYMALADSPIRDELEGDDYFGPGYFDAYEDEATWDEGFVELLNREEELIGAYYELSALADEQGYYSPAYFDHYADDLCQALIDLVLHRQQIAAYVGYDSYVQFAYDFYHYRDYTPAQAMAYMESIREEMSDLYRKVSQSDVWDGGYGYCDEKTVYNYVKYTTAAMGGLCEEAFLMMESAGLYDLNPSDKKFNTSFELYLTSYDEPYIFVCPSGYSYDKLSFAHEFGHFVTDYAAWGSYAGIDILEVFSQGMEYLSLFYDDGEELLEKYKMADCLATYAEQSAYACFEHQLYELTPAELTVENVYALYGQTMESFGVDFEVLGWDRRDLVTVPHFYTDPLYIISYVVSNDAAFQLFQMELDDRGTGLAKFEENLTTECYYFLEFVEEAGLVSPFAPGRVEQVADDLKDLLR